MIPATPGVGSLLLSRRAAPDTRNAEALREVMAPSVKA